MLETSLISIRIKVLTFNVINLFILQRSLVTQGSNRYVTSDRCVEMETVLFSLPAIVVLPAILAFEIENSLSLQSQLSLRQRDAN